MPMKWTLPAACLLLLIHGVGAREQSPARAEAELKEVRAQIDKVRAELQRDAGRRDKLTRELEETEKTVSSARGELERARIIRSSGSQLLDDEALRAIRAAAPFPPIPSWIEANPLSILAAMEYHDNRVHYQIAR